MKRHKVLTFVCCLALVIGLAGPAAASLINMDIGGDTVVYDDFNNLYWYPMIDEFTGMTLDEQLAEIDGMDYGGTSNWRMADWGETSLLKLSLMTMATEAIMPTMFGPDFGTPVVAGRDISSPFLAWNVDSEAFFNPTGVIDLSVIGVEGGGVMFNGRTNGWGMTNTGPGGFGGDVVPGFNPADDHWVSISFMNEGDDYLTFLGNFDQHYRLPSDLIGPGGSIGAWAVAEPIPEPATMLLFGTGLAGLAGIVSRRKKR